MASYTKKKKLASLLLDESVTLWESYYDCINSEHSCRGGFEFVK
jgi:hypothetical protein